MEKVLFDLYVFTQQAMLSTYLVPGTVPVALTQMSKMTLSFSCGPMRGQITKLV